MLQCESAEHTGIAQEAAEAAVTHKAGLIESNSDNAMLSCGTQSNPYQLAAVSWGDLRVNANIVDYMNAYGDPRMPKFFNKSTLAGKTDKYVGMHTGDADFKRQMQQDSLFLHIRQLLN